MGEFNQCSAQLKQLYSLHGLSGSEDEFTGYRILYMIHTLNRHDLIELISSVGPNPGKAVKHALQIRSSLSNGDYNTFFHLTHTAPYMSGYLIDQFLPKERLKTFYKLVKAYRPTLTVEFLAKNLGFVPPESSVSKKHLHETFSYIRSFGITISKGDIDCKSAAGILVGKVMEVESQGVDIKGQIH